MARLSPSDAWNKTHRGSMMPLGWSPWIPNWGTTVSQDALRGIVVVTITDRSSSVRRTRRRRRAMRKLAAKLKEEFEALLPPTIFFFVALHMVALIRVLMLKGTGIVLGTSVSVTLMALILGKAVLLADMLPFINRYPTKPLIYNVVWKTAIYTL